jgi:hypothetical protein
MTIDPQPGDAGFATISGLVGEIPYRGQNWLHDACRFDHVFWVVNALGDEYFPDGRIVQAMPSGAEFQDLRPRLAPGFAFARVDLSAEQRAMVPAIAVGFVNANGGRGVAYSWGTYLAMALARFAVTRGLVPGLRKIIENHGRLICSGLVDEGLRRVGYHCFDDGRWKLDVTPGDLYYALDPRVVQPAPASVDGA